MANYSVLIAEDHFDFLDLLKERISGFDNSICITIAENGYEALSKIREKQFDLLITDFNMPVMNGMELVKSLKTIDKNKRPRNVIMLSAFLEPGEPSSDLNFVRFLPKDEFKEDLFELLEITKDKGRVERKEVKRGTDRISLSAKSDQVKVNILGKNFVDIIKAKDISKGGIAIYVPHFIIDCKIDELVECQITLPGGKLVNTRGRIKHMGNDKDFFFGIEFLKMDVESRNNLTMFCESRFRATA